VLQQELPCECPQHVIGMGADESPSAARQADMGQAECAASGQSSQVRLCTLPASLTPMASNIYALRSNSRSHVRAGSVVCLLAAIGPRDPPLQYAKRVITVRDGLQLGSAAKSGGTKTSDRQHYASPDGPKRRWHRLAGHMGCVAVFLLFLWSIRVTRRHFRHPHRKVSCCPPAHLLL